MITLTVAISCVFSISQTWTPLFNGENIDGWTIVNGDATTWVAKDNMIVTTGKPTGVMRTNKMYENFILELDWRHMVENGNAGLFVWSDPIPAVGLVVCLFVVVICCCCCWWWRWCCCWCWLLLLGVCCLLFLFVVCSLFFVRWRLLLPTLARPHRLAKHSSDFFICCAQGCA